MFTLAFKTENAAFDENKAEECIWVLNQITRSLRMGAVDGVCVDSNGNTIGTWVLVADRDDDA